MIKSYPEILSAGKYNGSVLNKGKKITSKRRVNFYEIDFITHAGGVSHVDDESYDIVKGRIICAKPGQTRFTELPYRCRFIHFSCDNEELCAALNALPNMFIPEAPDEYEEILCLIAEHLQTQTVFGNVTVMALFFKFVEKLMREAIPEEILCKKKQNSEYIMRKAIDFIDINFRDKLTLEDVSEHVHMSKIYFHTSFTETFGMTPYKYILGKRLDHAKNLLASCDMSLGEIAYECGFSSQSYMNYVFKKEYGVTPKKYMTEMKAKG